jgi:hypothetical protein
MAQQKLTIELPGSAEALHNVLKMLLEYGLISEKKARTIEQDRAVEKPVKKNRWAQVAEEMSAQAYLKGRGEELAENIREFRDGFEIQDPFNQAVK